MYIVIIQGMKVNRSVGVVIDIPVQFDYNIRNVGFLFLFSKME